MKLKTEAVRDRILSAASRIFLENGFDKASMSQIAACAGGSKSTLYNYFASKEEIFAAVIRFNAHNGIEQAFVPLNDPDAPLPVCLQRFGVAYLERILAPDILTGKRIIQHNATTSNVARIYYDNGPGLGWAKVADYLAGHMARGHLCEAPSQVAAAHLRGLLEAEFLEKSLLALIDTPDQAALQASVERSVAVFLRAYAPA